MDGSSHVEAEQGNVRGLEDVFGPREPLDALVGGIEWLTDT